MKFQLITLKNFSIYEQLQIEECLLRCDERNFFIINQGSPVHIVLGLSNKIDEHVNEEALLQNDIPIIKRFSGGGSIIVDKNTIFTSFICDKNVLSTKCFPETIMQWSAEFYEKALQLKSFKAIDNDYAIKDQKCGGNAQYITKQRFVHHTSFLWDFDIKNMQLLKMPPKTPSYRKKRSHNDFLCTLKKYVENENTMRENIIKELKKRWEVKNIALEEIAPMLSTSHRKSTKKIRR